MPLFTVKYRKRKELVKEALQFQVETDTYEQAIEQFYKKYSWAEYMVVNPEEQKGEYFVGNSYRQKEEQRLKDHGIRYRVGERAYDIEGHLLSSRYRPLFISQSDIKKFDQMMKKG